jgi:hypothetical protein
MALMFDRHLVGTDMRSFDDRHLLTDETDLTSFDKHVAVKLVSKYSKSITVHKNDTCPTVVKQCDSFV